MSKIKKLNINLAPGGIEKKRREFLRNNLRRGIMFEAFVCVGLLVFTLSLSWKLNTLQDKLASVEKDWKATEPLLKEKESLVSSKEHFIEIFKSLKGIFKKDLSWHAILSSFSRLIPEEIWFNDLAFNEAGSKKVLEIKANIGYIASDEDKLKKMHSFLEGARRDKVLSENFDVPDLQDVTKTKMKDQDVMNIKFSLTLKE